MSGSNFPTDASDQAHEHTAPRKLVQGTDIRQQINKITLMLWDNAFIQSTHGKPLPPYSSTLTNIEATDQILALISQTVSNCIGEDEAVHNYLNNELPGFGEHTRNNLRAEQRATAKRLLGREV